MRYPTWTESATLIAICLIFCGLILCGLMLPTSQERRQRELRETAANWKPEFEVAVANRGVLSNNFEIAGVWSRGTRRAGSEIKIAPTEGSIAFRVDFQTGEDPWRIDPPIGSEGGKGLIELSDEKEQSQTVE